MENILFLQGSNEVLFDLNLNIGLKSVINLGSDEIAPQGIWHDMWVYGIFINMSDHILQSGSFVQTETRRVKFFFTLKYFLIFSVRTVPGVAWASQYSNSCMANNIKYYCWIYRGLHLTKLSWYNNTQIGPETSDFR